VADPRGFLSTRERELRILRARFPSLPAQLAEGVVAAVAKLRDMELKKPPSISETLDWAQSLVLLNADVLTPELVAATLNVVLKYESDAERARLQAPQLAQG